MIELDGGGGLVTKLCPTLATPLTVACQAPLSMRSSRQEYWSGVPLSSPFYILTKRKTKQKGNHWMFLRGEERHF